MEHIYIYIDDAQKQKKRRFKRSSTVKNVILHSSVEGLYSKGYKRLVFQLLLI